MVAGQLGPNDNLAATLAKLRQDVDNLLKRDVLQNASIGAGGITVNGGSITVTGTGSINLTSGTLNANIVNATTSMSTGALTVSGNIGTGTLSTVGNAAIGGTLGAANVNATGNINATAGTIVGNVVKTTTGPTTNITAARVAAWLQNSDGLIGTATSSERFKTDMRAMVDEPDFDPLAVLDLTMMFWSYRAEVARRDDPSSPDYVGPEYHVGLNFGPIAERAHELGLWMIVVYERDTVYETRTETVTDLVSETDEDGEQQFRAVEREVEVSDPVGDRLRLDDDGQPIPYALHDSLFGYLLQVAVKKMREEQVADRRLLLALARQAGIDPTTGEAETR